MLPYFLNYNFGVYMFDRKGMTLIELMMVLAIMITLAVAGIWAIGALLTPVTSTGPTTTTTTTNKHDHIGPVEILNGSTSIAQKNAEKWANNKAKVLNAEILDISCLKYDSDRNGFIRCDIVMVRQNGQALVLSPECYSTVWESPIVLYSMGDERCRMPK